ncbi:hypothetical protein BGM09_06460 [Streptomyces sp. CBMA29]|nr:hypothetical protein [Streptomyces sp. CBMA29]
MVLLLGPRTPGRHGGVDQALGVGRGTSKGWRLDVEAGRRRRKLRCGQVPPAESWQPQPQARGDWFAPEDWEDLSALVRPYVSESSDMPSDACPPVGGAAR